MVEQLFPRARDDGSITVAARLTLTGTDAYARVGQLLTQWSTRHADDDLLRDLSSPPRIEQIDPTTVDVIIEGRPGSRLWKGLLIDLTRDLTSQGSAALTGFWDLVAGQPHPASLRPHDITHQE
jgi:hypothetical protein